MVEVTRASGRQGLSCILSAGRTVRPSSEYDYCVRMSQRRTSQYSGRMVLVLNDIEHERRALISTEDKVRSAQPSGESVRR